MSEGKWSLNQNRSTTMKEIDERIPSSVCRMLQRFSTAVTQSHLSEFILPFSTAAAAAGAPKNEPMTIIIFIFNDVLRAICSLHFPRYPSFWRRGGDGQDRILACLWRVLSKLPMGGCCCTSSSSVAAARPQERIYPNGIRLLPPPIRRWSVCDGLMIIYNNNNNNDFGHRKTSCLIARLHTVWPNFWAPVWHSSIIRRE